MKPPVAAAPAAATPARRGPAWRRLPLLLLGFVALLAGTLAGLARFGWPMPAPVAQAAGLHGPLMVCGFFGVVIALERAVALGRAWAYAGPLAAGAGTALVLLGDTTLGAAAYVVAAVVLLLATLRVWRVQREAFVGVLALGAAAWLIGNLLWAAGAAVVLAVPGWLAFLVFTIAGERLELSRFAPRPRSAQRSFGLCMLVLTLALVAGLPALPAREFAARAFGFGLLALAAWLVRHDLARRTVRQRGLPRYIAVCLLSGYAWLALGGATLLLQGLGGNGPAYDLTLHALLVGFVLAMVFGHAPIVLPAVLRVTLPYRPRLYAPLAALHAALGLRALGDAFAMPAAARWGALGTALTLVLFVATLLSTLQASPRAARAKTPKSDS